MFQPPLFQEDRQDVLCDLIKKHPFATVVTAPGGMLTADHVPLVLDTTSMVLEGHLAAANPVARSIDKPIDALAIFQGPQAYVSPSWYPSKKKHGKAVPTWNYVVVHAHGTLRLIRDEDWIYKHLKRLTAQHEQSREDPWDITDAPADYVKRQMRGLVGFDITIETFTGTWKASQNKQQSDRKGVETALLEQNSSDALAMSDLISQQSD